ncbi:unnamed protein product [Rhodiola kirilowii]
MRNLPPPLSTVHDRQPPPVAVGQGRHCHGRRRSTPVIDGQRRWSAGHRRSTALVGRSTAVPA